MLKYILALPLAVAGVAGTGNAAITVYDFSAVVTAAGAPGPLIGSGIEVGDLVHVRLLVNDDIAPNAVEGDRYSFFEAAVVGGGFVETGSTVWTVGGPKHNAFAVWDDYAIGGNVIFDGISVAAPFSGPSLNGLGGDYVGFSLFSYKSGANGTFSNATFPRLLPLPEFNGNAKGSFAFAGATEVGRFDLDVLSADVAVVPETGSMELSLAALNALLGVRYMQRCPSDGGPRPYKRNPGGAAHDETTPLKDAVRF